MKVMVIVKASPDSEAGVMPTQELLTAMGKFNEELVKAGIMESGDGLKPSSEGFRVRFSGKKRSVTSGPFAETSELIAGYWVWNVKSMEQALEWVKKCPNPMQEDSDIEIRPFFEMEDFAEIDTTGEVREQETALRNTISMQKTKVITYLFFTGRCEEALVYYQKHLGAKLERLIRIKESPEPMPEGMFPKEFDDKVMHSEFTVGNAHIFATDCGDPGTSYSGFSLTLTVQTAADAHRVFDALADGGTVRMPLSKTFWSPLYGQVTDKYGIGWMVMLPEQNVA
jgi:PhnB protein